MRRRFFTADVFTDRIFGGNPLAVFPDGSGLSGETMQAVAREMNLSETVFVLPPETPGGTRRLRIFTPATELPFAGHPTLGTAFVLAATGEIPFGAAKTRIVLEEGVGPVPVSIESRGGAPVRCELTREGAPELGPEPPPAAELAACLGLAPGDLEGPARSASAGVPYVFVPLRSRDALARARIDGPAWQRHLSASWAHSVYAFTRDAEGSGCDLRARMFAPGLGVEEDPATGSAVAAFAAVLAELRPGAPARQVFRIAQGIEMGRPSRLDLSVDVSGGAIRAVHVAGESVLVASGEMEIPEEGA